MTSFGVWVLAIERKPGPSRRLAPNAVDVRRDLREISMVFPLEVWFSRVLISFQAGSATLRIS